jgi:hypothetical protein
MRKIIVIKVIALIALIAMIVSMSSCGTTSRGYSACPSHDKYFFNRDARYSHGPTFGR